MFEVESIIVKHVHDKLEQLLSVRMLTLLCRRRASIVSFVRQEVNETCHRGGSRQSVAMEQLWRGEWHRSRSCSSCRLLDGILCRQSLLLLLRVDGQSLSLFLVKVHDPHSDAWTDAEHTEGDTVSASTEE
jgi:hypothetical protein